MPVPPMIQYNNGSAFQPRNIKARFPKRKIKEEIKSIIAIIKSIFADFRLNLPNFFVYSVQINPIKTRTKQGREMIQ